MRPAAGTGGPSLVLRPIGAAHLAGAAVGAAVPATILRSSSVAWWRGGSVETNEGRSPRRLPGLLAADTRVFLFRSPNAAADRGGAMDAVNNWLAKDRSGGPYANLRVRNVAVSDDGKGGIYVTVVCSLGRAGGSSNSGEPVGAAASRRATEPGE